MKKQESTKKKWLIPLAGLAVLLVAAAVLAITILGGNGPAATQPTGETAGPSGTMDTAGKLYWNVDPQPKTRMAASDGLYRIRFACDGEQFDLFTADYLVAARIDMLDVMGLILDENGYIIEARHVTEMGMKYNARKAYVTALDGNVATLNSSGDYTGFSRQVTIPEEAKIYTVGGDLALTGLPAQLEMDDEVTAIENSDGQITHVYTSPMKPVGKLYWNVNRQYDSTSKVSLRPRNELGYFDYEMVCEGQTFLFSITDQELANKLDSAAGNAMGLVFDDEGNVIDIIPFGQVVGGRVAASWLNVTAYDKEAGTLEFKNGSTGIIAREHWCYDVSGAGEFIGAPTEIQVGDKVFCINNSRGKIAYTFIVGNRKADVPMYWNVDRSWNKQTLSTNRVPQSDGYYHFRMAVDGKHVTVRVKDLAMANEIEKAVCIGLKLDGDLVTKTYGGTLVTGGSVFASWYEVTSLGADGAISAYKKDGNKSASAVLAEDCVFYDVSSLASMEGIKVSRSFLNVGDTVHCYENPQGQVCLVYIVTRYSNSPIYWNVARQWDSKAEASKRTPGADGYYRVALAVNGEQKEYKTKDKKIIDFVDSKSWMALDISGDVITRPYVATQTHQTRGGTFGLDYTVTAIEGSTITATSDKGKVVTAKMASGCKVYDVSPTAAQKGQKGSVCVGDRIWALKNPDKDLSYIYLINVANHTPHVCDCCGENVIWKPYKVGAKLTTGHYSISADTLAWATYAEGANVTICLNGKNIQGNERVFETIPAGVTVNIVDCGDAHVHGNVIKTGAIARVEGTLNIYGGTYTHNTQTGQSLNGSMLLVQDGGVVNLYGGTFTGSGTDGFGGVVGVVSSIFNMHGGTLNGATVGKLGGAVGVFSEKDTTATFNFYGGTINGGTAGTYGGAVGLYADGGKTVFNQSGGTVRGGKATEYGGAVGLSKNCTYTMSGGTITGGESEKYGGTVGCPRNSVFNLHDGTVSGGTSGTYGGCFGVLGGQLNLLGGTVQGGTAATHGGCISIANGDLAMAKGTVSGGTAGSYGDNLSLANSARAALLGGTIQGGVMHDSSETVTLGGSIQITGNEKGNLIFTRKGKLEGYQLQGAKVGIKVTTPGLVMTNVTQEEANCIENEGQGTFLWEENTLVMKVLHIHCFCTGADTLPEGHVCDQAAVWEPVEVANNKIIIEESGNYYLNWTGRVAGALHIAEGKEVCLCLNGAEIFASTTVTLGKDAKLTVCDCFEGQTGAISVSKAAKVSPIRLDDGQALNLMSGTLRGSANSGAQITVTLSSKTAVLNVFGGQICDGTNGNILLNKGTVNLRGGTVTAGKEWDIQVSAEGKLNLGGKAVPGSIVLDGGAVNVLPTLEQGTFSITPKQNGVIVTGLTEAQKAWFTVTEGETTYKAEDQTLSVKLPVAGHAHCFCAGAQTSIKDHVCQEDRLWTILDADTTLTDGGHYYLEEDLTRGLSFGEGEFFLCLNGKTLKSGVRVLGTLAAGTTLHICDCSAKQDQEGNWTYDGKIEGTLDNQAPVVSVSGGSLNIYGGGFTAKAVTASGTKNGGLMNLLNKAVINQYGGDLYGGNTKGNGGNINVSNGTYTLHGGTIRDGVSNLSGCYGGNVAVTAATGKFVMYGGTVSGGNAAFAYGGNIGNKSGTVELCGGTVSDGTSKTYGGNIGMAIGGMVTLEQGAVTGGKSTTYGGNIGILAGTLHVKGGTVTMGAATTHGGNIGIGGGTVNITDGTVSDGASTTNGGNISVMNGAPCTVTGGTISGGSSGKAGTSIYADKASLTVGGTAKINDVRLKKDVTLKISTTAPLTAGASIGITPSGGTEIFATGLREDLSAFFHSTDAAKTVTYEDGSLKLTDK